MLPDYPDPDSFCWEKYLEETGTSAVPTWAFKEVSLSLPALTPGSGAISQAWRGLAFSVSRTQALRLGAQLC